MKLFITRKYARPVSPTDWIFDHIRWTAPIAELENATNGQATNVKFHQRKWPKSCRRSRRMSSSFSWCYVCLRIIRRQQAVCCFQRQQGRFVSTKLLNYVLYTQLVRVATLGQGFFNYGGGCFSVNDYFIMLCNELTCFKVRSYANKYTLISIQTTWFHIFI